MKLLGPKQATVEKYYDVAIIKLDKAQQIAYGVVLEAETEDTQHDIISEEEIKKTAYDFILAGQDVNNGLYRSFSVGGYAKREPEA